MGIALLYQPCPVNLSLNTKPVVVHSTISNVRRPQRSELPAILQAETGLMIVRRESVIIEISEEAYKQNSVYRPWGEIGQAPSAVSHPTRMDGSAATGTISVTKQLDRNMDRKGVPSRQRSARPSFV